MTDERPSDRDASSDAVDLSAGHAHVCVSADDAGVRLDRFVASLPGAPSRSQVKAAIARGDVTVDGDVPTKAGVALAQGQWVRVELSPPEPPPSLEPQAIPLDILHEDDHLLVVLKPSGLVVHPAPGHPRGTLANALLHHLGEDLRKVGANGRPGIVHRLDRETSGVMVVAKTLRAHAALGEQFTKHDIERTYLALAVGGALPDDERVTFDTLHGRHARDRLRFTSRVDRGRRAVTHVEVVERLAHGVALVTCTLETGRTHQIRVHLSEHHAPILGDSVYGGRLMARRPLAPLIDRVALHASVLGFEHPDTGDRVRWEAPPPRDFQRALEELRKHR